MLNERNTEPGFRERVVFFLNSHWKAALALIGVMVVLMAGILIWDFVRRDNTEKSAVAAEDIQSEYEKWMTAAEDERDEKELNRLINLALEKYPRQFAAQRALFVRGLVALEKEEWSGASAAFESLAEKWPESYLSSTALINAAGAREEAGETEKALELWSRVESEYSESVNVPEAMFNIARLQEALDKTDSAVENYNSLVDRFPRSKWADLAKSRSLLLSD